MVWENVPVCLPWDGNGTGIWEVIWLNGRDGSPRFCGGTKVHGCFAGRDHGTGREQVGKLVGNIVGKSVMNIVDNRSEHNRKNGRENGREIGPERSRDMAGTCNPELSGTRSRTNAG